MGYGVISIVAAIVIFVLAEKCRRTPGACRDSFMSTNGLTRSFVALRFLGRAQEAREAIVRDPVLRRQFLLERYLIALLGMIVGILLMINS